MDVALEKRRGRPPKAGPTVLVKFKMQKAQADYLLAVAKRFGWGLEINEVVRSLVVGEVIALQKRRFHTEKLPGE